MTDQPVNIYQQILQKYWGYREFRPFQDDIIKAVVAGHDTIALMPTGGGKSVTYQVPGIAMEGLCLVITPLIALMKDQVENLNQRGIKALAVHSGMSADEIDVTLDNAIYGGFKFLYIAPERINTKIFRVRLEHMKINLVAVDEAHCISQWGYDFRPSYLQIVDLRDFLPGVPFLALTATATPEVIEDIKDKLKFRESNLFRASFVRENLTYTVRKVEDKQRYILKIAEQIRGSGIIYVRSRKKTRELALFLHKNRISCDYYHAGLEHSERNRKQNDWMNNKFRIIVATNAFGMGIDKADVRFVLHADLPDSTEAYFQEAGRAGRDNHPAHGILLFNETDKVTAGKRLSSNFPEIDTIKQVYRAIGNYFQVPVGAAKNQVFDFNIADFAEHYKLSIVTIYNSLKFLQAEGYVELTEEIHHPSKLKFLIDREYLYKFQVANAEFDAFIKLVLRTYTGLFTEFVTIYEETLASKANVPVDTIRQYLKRLTATGIVRYLPQKKTPVIIFTEERLDVNNLHISKRNYKDRKERFEKRMQSVLDYADQDNRCRSQYLVAYFGETDTRPCGHCDVCMKEKNLGLSSYELDLAVEEIRDIISNESLSLEKLVENISLDEDKAIRVVQWLLDNNRLFLKPDNTIGWQHK
jgi:ATP-dependent DNA helicase RecQ